MSLMGQERPIRTVRAMSASPPIATELLHHCDRRLGPDPLARVPRKRHALAAAGVVAAFKHLWDESWGPRLEHLLFHGIAALLESRRPTLINLARYLCRRGFSRPHGVPHQRSYDHPFLDGGV